MNNLDFFMRPVSVPQKQYEALRMYYVEKEKAKDVAEEFGYTYRAFTSIVSDFNNTIKEKDFINPFFILFSCYFFVEGLLPARLVCIINIFQII